MNITLLQLNPRGDKAANMEGVARLAADAVRETRPRVISLPEAWICLGGGNENVRSASEVLPGAPGEAGGPAYKLMQTIARENEVYVHGGSILERKDDRLKNTTIVFDPSGAEIARYSKIHMFDIVLPDGQANRESDLITPGEEVVTCQIDGVTVGLAICYDLRFPELFRALRDKGAELIFLPAAFRLQTGKDHWHPLIRARAIETQCWFAAAGTTGTHYNNIGEPVMTYGHSLICDPWGIVVAQASEGTGIVAACMDRSVTERVRRDIPLDQHRRLPL